MRLQFVRSSSLRLIKLFSLFFVGLEVTSSVREAVEQLIRSAGVELEILEKNAFQILCTSGVLSELQLPCEAGWVRRGGRMVLAVVG